MTATEPSTWLRQCDCLDMLRELPTSSVDLVLTSPPYNIGKEYEARASLCEYLAQFEAVAAECMRVLADSGSLCWQVGNYVDGGEIVPLDFLFYELFKRHGMKLRNRIVWAYDHGQHCTKRMSHRYETVLWFTKSDRYTFNLDPLRVPQKYPGKRHFKGPKKGQLSGNPLGKNPGDVWSIPPVSGNHVEKTAHPCQYPVELCERFVLAMTDPGGVVYDPYAGSGTTAVAALRHGRHAWASEREYRYFKIMGDRVAKELAGTLRTRPMHRVDRETATNPRAQPSLLNLDGQA